MSALLFAVAVGLAATPSDDGDRIHISSDLDAETAAQLSPGTTVEWFVDVTTTPGEPGTVTVSLAEVGDLGLEVEAFRCATEWEGGACAAGETHLRPLGRLLEDGTELLSMPDTDAAYLHLIVVAPTDLPESAQGSLRLTASGVGEPNDAEGPQTPLQPTGSMTLWGLACAAIGALGAGAAITIARAVRRAR
ncbi:hypothetical protein GCM10010922_26520 [Microbacterium sorbitolivorans]|uniref:Uncharacterized protein n=1 Tax=Microbacterium sorbitolivorans TaxID=1867410 RepID=A0A367XTA4_9MICO|nr:hypothetical protein [Microbacterium sorbitolivorans]RCK56853.1 hypothetical protein DTO57_13290 [Microbacterium sorbitolivorans]GGF49299.1 hypothetical protein GCM10010922_26520 [Microbacterium sorbitolivorans]